MTVPLLTLNAGSSSLKFAVFDADGAGLRRVAAGQVEGIGSAPHLTARAGDGAAEERRWPAGEHLSHEALLGAVFDWIEGALGGARPAAVGHRIVHGGSEFWRPVRLDAELLARLDALSPLAPLHEPHNLAAVRAAMAVAPGVPQVACFDTAFHHGHAPEVDRFGLPLEWEARGVRRYGFHGLSYEFIAGRVAELSPRLAAGRTIAAHLGAGASLCAMRGGRSADTTMGFTALDGLVMGTRCGALDPGVVLHLQQAHGLSPEAVGDLLYKRSGLLGVSGISGDMRALLASDDPRAAAAIDLFVFRIVREAGALAASMGGLDGLVFTAGVGENAPEIRRRVCARLDWLGCVLDPEANAAGPGRISAAESRLEVWVIPTDEEGIIARHTRELLA
ncbi:MAG: acetate/propionate family kinase [Phenylobacterium sp.]|uniref:acetate/propionate family kinase n=1 Tax=Phenylobacterium sp. TaxID=1871053 RepID=UPI0025D43461|nr:acetate/propionate family kinase [Phenylobacterium sp.]MBI1197067.1 acetate/propionate family kinase [Phenylobacterium sp.]